MDFIVKKKPTPSVPILPLIDILTILLIFFVVTTEFKKKRNTLEIALPSAGALPTRIVVNETNVLSISHDGKFALNNVQMKREELPLYLEVIYESHPNAKFEIEQDKKTGEQYELFALDALTKVGFRHISKRVLLEGQEKE